MKYIELKIKKEKDPFKPWKDSKKKSIRDFRKNKEDKRKYEEASD